MIFGQSLISGVLRGIIEDAVKTAGGDPDLSPRLSDAEQDPLRFQLPDDPALIAAMRTVLVCAPSRAAFSWKGMLSNGSIAAIRGHRHRSRDRVTTSVLGARHWSPRIVSALVGGPECILLGGALAEARCQAGATLLPVPPQWPGD